MVGSGSHEKQIRTGGAFPKMKVVSEENVKYLVFV